MGSDYQRGDSFHCTIFIGEPRENRRYKLKTKKSYHQKEIVQTLIWMWFYWYTIKRASYIKQNVIVVSGHHRFDGIHKLDRGQLGMGNVEKGKL